MEDLEKVVQRWYDLREQNEKQSVTGRTVDEIYKKAIGMLEKALEKGVDRIVLSIIYKPSEGFKIAVDGISLIHMEDVVIFNNGYIISGKRILAKTMEKFQEFPQLKVTMQTLPSIGVKKGDDMIQISLKE